MKVLVTGPFDADAVALLSAHGLHVALLESNVHTADLREAIADADAYVLGGSERVTPELVRAAARLRIIVFLGEQPDTFLADGAKDELALRGIRLESIPGLSTNAVAEMTCALIFASLRRIPYLTSQVRRRQWPSYTGGELAGKRLGIYGMGRIGYAVARRLSGFDLSELLYSDMAPSKTAERNLHARLVGLDELFAESDIVSIHAPLTDTTKGAVTRRLLRLMKPSAVLVNTARPGIVDPASLREALSEGWLASAAFDGYYLEGREYIDSHSDPYGLIAMDDRFFVTSHQGYNTTEALRAASNSASEMILDHLFRDRSSAA